MVRRLGHGYGVEWLWLRERLWDGAWLFGSGLDGKAVLRTQAEQTVWLEVLGLDTALNGCDCVEDFGMFKRHGLGYTVFGYGVVGHGCITDCGMSFDLG